MSADIVLFVGNTSPETNGDAVFDNAVKSAWNAALREAAAIARANTSAPRIWQDGAWFNTHGEDIALKIEALVK